MVYDAIISDSLTKQFGKLVAVDDLSFSVKRGEIFGFLGPNGSEKTTAISMLTTLLVPTKGSATVAGYDIVREASKMLLTWLDMKRATKVCMSQRVKSPHFLCLNITELIFALDVHPY